ncbi:MAG: hypothetical protein E7291_07375 [Lachnospiraceae bacterium]|nr:hypothetical protein [Lachnospiraceae bacterium]
MADIKNYLKEKEKREQNQSTYKDKIRKHKLTTVYRVLLVLIALGAVAALIMLQYKRHIYTEYDIVSSVSRDVSAEAVDLRLQDAILTYSKDGAHCTNSKGEVLWNQTYEIQDIRLETCRDVVAIGNYNGREIYVQSAEKQLGTINTTMPIRNLTVSAMGTVTAVLADTDVAWINTYNAEGENIFTGQAHMHDSGYPAAISLSPNGELLMVSYVYVDAGILKSDVAFYNLGVVGDNYSDHFVSVYSYSDMLVPEVQFINDSTAFAVGDSRIMIYTGAQKPVEAAQYNQKEEIQSIFYSDQYIGVVFISEKEDSRYRLDVYNADAERVGSYYFNIEYTDIFFGQNDFTVYNETECMIMNFEGVEKYNGYFSKAVNLMIPTGSAYKYILVTDNSIDTIQLK